MHSMINGKFVLNERPVPYSANIVKVNETRVSVGGGRVEHIHYLSLTMILVRNNQR
jgi:hypothetical protein